MYESAPGFMSSKYYDVEKGAMKPNAPDSLKIEYERYWNSKNMERVLKDGHPEFEHPFLSWEHKVIEKRDSMEG